MDGWGSWLGLGVIMVHSEWLLGLQLLREVVSQDPDSPLWSWSVSDQEN